MASSASSASSLHATSLAVCGHCTKELSPIQGISVQIFFISMTRIALAITLFMLFSENVSQFKTELTVRRLGGLGY